MKQNYLNKQAGFTLAEMLVVLMMLGIISLGLVGLYVVQMKLTSNDFKLSQAQTELGVGLNSVLPFITSARDILDTAEINSTVYVTSTDTLVISVPAINNSKEVIANTYDTIAIYYANNALQMATSTGAGSTRRPGSRTLVTELDSFSLSYENAELPNLSSWVNIMAGKTVQISQGNQNVDLSYRAYLRNK